MPTSSFFNNFSANNEQSLINDLVVESIKIHGIDVYYIHRSLGGPDKILNEDDLPTFDAAAEVEVYIKDVSGFQGDGDFMGKFGLEIRDQINMSISRQSFDRYVANTMNITRPREGDLIYLPLNNKIFEIRFTEHEPVFYQMGALQFYDIMCELYEFSNETFSTGVSVIDTLYDSIETTSNTSMGYVSNNIPLVENRYSQIEANNLLDFSDQNPFGDRW